MPSNARAILFDMDGTLVDSEAHTDVSIAAVMRRYGVDGARLPANDTRGRTWTHVVTTLQKRFPAALARADAAALESELVDDWGARVVGRVEPIPGSADAVRAAAAVARVAVVSSSPRDLVVRIVAALGVLDRVATVVAAEDVAHAKPAPDCWLEAARRLDVAPQACVVVEDARAGLVAAKAARMTTRLVLHRCAEPQECRALADDAFDHYASLPCTYWSELVARGAP